MIDNMPSGFVGPPKPKPFKPIKINPYKLGFWDNPRAFFPPPEKKKAKKKRIKRAQVYVVSDGNGHVKIGFSVYVKNRLCELQVGNALELKLLGSIDGSLKLEAKIHRHLKKHRANGEWFKICDRTNAVVDLIASKNTEKLNKLLRFKPQPEPMDLSGFPVEPIKRIYRKC